MNHAAYRVTARIQNNRLWSAIAATFPGVRTQAEAARLLNVTVTELSGLLTMRLWPGRQPNKRTGRLPESPWKKVAWTISTIVGETPEYLFDPKLYGRRAHAVTFELDQPQLAEAGLLLAFPAPDERIEQEELQGAITQMLATLFPKEAKILCHRFGLDGNKEETLAEVAERFDVTKERIRQIEYKALRKLRLPGRSRLVKELM